MLVNTFMAAPSPLLGQQAASAGWGPGGLAVLAALIPGPPLGPGCAQFIFISPEEMRAVADFIRSRGRIAIAELAHRSNE